MLPIITWKDQPWTQYTSGWANRWKDRIHIRCGSDITHTKMVMLHESAHMLLPDRHVHDAVFWRMAWYLYQKHGFDTLRTFEDEVRYKRQAGIVAVELGIAERTEERGFRYLQKEERNCREYGLSA